MSGDGIEVHMITRKKNIKIAMLGHKRIPSREGGVEVVVTELSVRMVKAGHNVCCYNRKGHHVSGKEHDHNHDIDVYKGIKLKSVLTIDKKGLAAFTSSIFAAIKAAFGKYDIVHFHAEGPCAMLWLPKLCGKRCIATIHGLDWKREKWQNGFGSKYIRFGEKIAAKYADEVIVLSRSIQEYFMAAYGRRTHYIPNGVNKPEIRAADLIKEKYGLYKDSYICYLGRLTEEKGVHYLIEAYKQLNTDKKLVIAGGASDTDDYAKKIKAMASDDNRIIFTGFVQGDIFVELYSNAYVYVLPSNLEGMPLSLLEAMSYSNCCIVSDIAECVEVVEGKGITFRKGSVVDLKEKMQNACNNPDEVQKYKSAASDFICKKYNWNDVVDQTLNVYSRTVCQKHSPNTR